MPPDFRTAALAFVCALACNVATRGADQPNELLPPEPKSGEWIEDSLNDSSLWFASSENLELESVASELADYSAGRRWVKLVDGRPAWVMYYVPGEILGFEVDTHHLGAQATNFTFSAGADWKSMQPVDVEFEEITDFAAKWLRLYRSAQHLPAGTRFLRIEFPDGDDRDAARLTEVWLRCHFDDESTAANSTPNAEIESADARIARSEGAAASTPPAVDDLAAEELQDTIVEPFVVRGIILNAPPTEFASRANVAFVHDRPHFEVRPAESPYGPLSYEDDLARLRALLEKPVEIAEPIAPVRRIIRYHGPPSK